METKDIINLFSGGVIFLLATASMVVTIRIILRTKSEIDKGFKYISIAFPLIVISSLIYIDKIIAFSGLEHTVCMFSITIALSLIFIFIGLYKILIAFST